MKTRRAFIKNTAIGGIAGILASGASPSIAQNTRQRRSSVSIEEARRVHKKMLVFDGHNDTPVERVARKELPFNWMKRDMTYNTDVPRMKEGGPYTAFMIVGNGLIADVWITTERVLKSIEDNPNDLMLVLNAKDAEKAGKENKIGCVLSIEGAAKWLDGKLEVVYILHRLNHRLLGITHGEGGEDPKMLQGAQSLYRLSTPEERENDRKNSRGLTPFGIDVLKASNELGIVTDLSHINDKAFYDVLERSSLPPIMSHTAVYALCNHARCMTDDQIKALAAKGGAMGVAFAPQFIYPEGGDKATIERFVDHIAYIADLVGVDYAAIGTDYDGLGKETVPVVPEVSQLPLVTKCMMERGFSEEEMRKIWGGNFLRIFKQVTGA